MITGARIRATLFCVLAIIMQASAADPGLGDVMEALSAIRLSESKYTEEKHYEMMDLPMIQQGVLRYESPEKLAWERGDNGQGRYEIHENQLITRRHDKVEIISLESMPALRAFIESFRATLAGNEQRLRQYYVVTFSGMVESWKLQLQPRDRTMRRFIDQIIIQGEKDQLRMIEIYEMNGDWSRMKLEPVRQEYHAG